MRMVSDVYNIIGIVSMEIKYLKQHISLAPQNTISLEFNSMGIGNSSHRISVEFMWSQPSERNGSYYFELEYSATQNFNGGRNISLTNMSQISGQQLNLQFNDGLPYAIYEVRIFAYNIKRGRTFGGPLTTQNYLSVPISKL